MTTRPPFGRSTDWSGRPTPACRVLVDQLGERVGAEADKHPARRELVAVRVCVSATRVHRRRGDQQHHRGEHHQWRPWPRVRGGEAAPPPRRPRDLVTSSMTNGVARSASVAPFSLTSEQKHLEAGGTSLHDLNSGEAGLDVVRPVLRLSWPGPGLDVGEGGHQDSGAPNGASLPVLDLKGVRCPRFR